MGAQARRQHPSEDRSAFAQRLRRDREGLEPRSLLDGAGVPRAVGDADSEGEVRGMEVRDWLKRESNDGKKPVKQIVFAGDRFDVTSVRRWRERVLCATGKGL